MKTWIIIGIIIIILGIFATLFFTGVFDSDTSMEEPLQESKDINPAPATGTPSSYATSQQVAPVPANPAPEAKGVTLPCDPYTDSSTNISRDCYNQIWVQAGCTVDGLNSVIADGWWQKQTKAALVADSKSWATMKDDAHRKGCYGSNKSKWPSQYIRYLHNLNYLHY